MHAWFIYTLQVVGRLSVSLYIYVCVHVYIHICGTRRVVLECSDISEDVTAEQHHSNGSREVI